MVLQQALADLNTAYRNFFASVSGKRKGRKVAPPRFRSRKDNRQAIRFTTNARFKVTDDGRLRLPKIGDVPVRWSRGPALATRPRVTVIKDAAGRYFASFVVEAEPTSRSPQADAEVGHRPGPDALRGPVRRHEDRRAEVPAPGGEETQAGCSGRCPARRRDRQPGKARHEGRPAARPGGRRAPRVPPPALHADHPREPSGVRGGPGGQGTRPAPGWPSPCTTRAGRRSLAMLEYKATRYGRTFARVGRFFPSSQTVLGLRDARRARCRWTSGRGPARAARATTGTSTPRSTSSPPDGRRG